MALVLNCKFLDQGGSTECNEVWVVDFGAQYGVQCICVIDCEVIPPPTQWQGPEGEARSPVPAEWVPMGEGIAANLLEYRWSRGRGVEGAKEEELGERSLQDSLLLLLNWGALGHSVDHKVNGVTGGGPRHSPTR